MTSYKLKCEKCQKEFISYSSNRLKHCPKCSIVICPICKKDFDEKDVLKFDICIECSKKIYGYEDFKNAKRKTINFCNEHKLFYYTSTHNRNNCPECLKNKIKICIYCKKEFVDNLNLNSKYAFCLECKDNVPGYIKERGSSNRLCFCKIHGYYYGGNQNSYCPICIENEKESECIYCHKLFKKDKVTDFDICSDCLNNENIVKGEGNIILYCYWCNKYYKADHNFTTCPDCKKITIKRNCKECKKEFYTYHSNIKYCEECEKEINKSDSVKLFELLISDKNNIVFKNNNGEYYILKPLNKDLIYENFKLNNSYNFNFEKIKCKYCNREFYPKSPNQKACGCCYLIQDNCLNCENKFIRVRNLEKDNETNKIINYDSPLNYKANFCSLSCKSYYSYNNENSNSNIYNIGLRVYNENSIKESEEENNRIDKFEFNIRVQELINNYYVKNNIPPEDRKLNTYIIAKVARSNEFKTNNVLKDIYDYLNNKPKLDEIKERKRKQKLLKIKLKKLLKKRQAKKLKEKLIKERQKKDLEKLELIINSNLNNNKNSNVEEIRDNITINNDDNSDAYSSKEDFIFINNTYLNFYKNKDFLREIYLNKPGMLFIYGTNIKDNNRYCLTGGQTKNLYHHLLFFKRYSNKNIIKENPEDNRWFEIANNYKDFNILILYNDIEDKNKREILETKYALEHNSIYWKPSITQLGMLKILKGDKNYGYNK